MGSNYNTRNAKKLVGISRKLKKSNKLTHVMGPTVYNNLPQNIIDASSVCNFKHRLKNWLVEHPFYTYEEFIMHTGSVPIRTDF